MIVHDEAYYESRMPVKDLGPMKNFMRFIWDGKRRAFLDRTAKDWALLGVFYLCFFGVLFSLFAFQMWITLYYISGYDKPYMQHSSQIDRSFYEAGAKPFFRAPFSGFVNPGLGFAPNVLTPMTSPIIWVSDTSEKSKPEIYIQAITKFLEGYNRNPSLYDMHCVNGRFRPGFGQKPCFFDTKTLGHCSIPPYGYTWPFKPCVYVKFNKRFDWIPRYYNGTSELPEIMPMKLRSIVRSSDEFHVWLSCTGASNVDKEHLGEIDYLPTPGYPVQYFPFAGQRDYMSPMVALVFKNLTGITGLFYLVFFSCLAVFCSICMYGLMLTLSYEKPRWTLDSSLIGTNPGLGFRPIPLQTEQRSLIWYRAKNETEVQSWISNVDDFLENYINSSLLPNGGRNQQMCDYQQQTVKEGFVCAVEVSKWGPCSPQEGYGFNHSSPCIFIKLNRIYGWVPDYYNNPKELPDAMPTSLQNTIKNASSNELNTIWISCKGADPGDAENIGPIEYFPSSQGFPGFYYPYLNTPGYLSPLVAVHFKRPEPNVIISVECRAWAKNIDYDPSLKLGMVHFELLID